MAKTGGGCQQYHASRYGQILVQFSHELDLLLVTDLKTQKVRRGPQTPPHPFIWNIRLIFPEKNSIVKFFLELFYEFFILRLNQSPS